MKKRKGIVLALLCLFLLPLHAQDVMEISYKDAGTPATVLSLADIGKLWFADDMLQASSASAPTQVTKASLAGISRITFKNSQTAVQRLNVSAAEGYTVYDLQGRQVLATSSASAVDALPHGIYIVRSNNKTIKISK
jgi:hypothetical protein